MEPESLSPANVPAERVVLGAVIEDEGILSAALGAGLKQEYFSLPDHRRIFAAVLALRDSRGPVDYISVAEQLGNSPDDLALVAGLIDGVVIHRGHVLWHVALIRKKSRLRELQTLGQWLLDSAAEPGADPEQLAEAACERLGAVGVDL